MMEEKIYDRQVTKQSLSARVVDEHQIGRHFSMNELAELYEFNDEPESARPTPAVPKDLLLAELIQKRPKLIWKYHDHDSLLENQTDENLTEEERAAAWKEFENEKKGFMATFDNADMQNAMSSSIDPQAIQQLYRARYPQMTNEQLNQATRAYIMQAQSALHNKPAYDKSHYQQEMQKIKQAQNQLYPNMYRSAAAGQAGASTGSGWAAGQYAEQMRQQQLLMQQMAAMQQQQQQQYAQQWQTQMWARQLQQMNAAKARAAVGKRSQPP